MDRAVRKSRNYDHRKYRDLGRVPRFLAIAVIFGRLCIKSAKWSFSDANLVVKINGMQHSVL